MNMHREQREFRSQGGKETTHVEKLAAEASVVAWSVVDKTKELSLDQAASYEP